MGARVPVRKSSRVSGILPLVLCFLHCQHIVRATVLLRTEFAFTPIPDAAANFGQPVPLEGLSGHVLTVTPEDACTSSITPTRKKDVREYHARDGLGWIALIKRSEVSERAIGTHGKGGDSSSSLSSIECSFEHKVRVATEAGASAVIVYDVVHEGLVTMSIADRGEHALNNLVPSVFISKESGALLKALIASSGLVQVIITPVNNVLDMWTSFVMSLVAGCFAFSLVMGAVCMVRYGTRGYMEEDERPSVEGQGRGGRMVPLTKRELQELTRVIPYRSVGGIGGVGRAEDEEGEEEAPCSICLQEYEAGEKLRRLPCGHVFHRDCVDEWLLGESKLCPMCKRSVVDAAQVADEAPAVDGEQEEERVPWWQPWRRRWQPWQSLRRGDGRDQELSVLLERGQGNDSNV